MSFDIHDNVHRSRAFLGMDTFAKILTKLQKLGVKIEEFAILHHIPFSPYINKHNLEHTDEIAEPDEAAIIDDKMDLPYYKIIPHTVYPYPLAHSTVGGGAFTFPFAGRKFGGGVQTDGSINIVITSHADLNPTDKIAIMLWLYPKAFTGSEQVIVIKDQQYKIVLNASQNRLEFSVYISGSWGTPCYYTYTPDTWVGIIANWDGTNAKLYAATALVDTQARSGTLNTTSNDLGILGTPAGGSRAASGTKLSWFDIEHANVVGITNWITNWYDGVLNTQAADNVTTIPFMDTVDAQPDATMGLCYCGP